MKDLYYNIGLLVLRLGFGATMAATHGWGKLIGFSKMAAEFPDPLGVGSVISLGLCVFAEFFCSLAISLGFTTRWAAIPAIINMAVAAFIVHGADPFEKKEKALLYLAGYVAIALLGPGKYALGRNKK